MEKNKYYSQLNQDKFLNKVIFKNIKNKFFLDIGAYDGKDGSNSLFFEKNLNWKGICIEPIPEVFKKLKKIRKNLCLNLAVGNKNKKVKFLKIKSDVDMQLSGIEEYNNNIDKEKYNIDEIEVEMITTTYLFKKYNINEIEYLSLDVEGAEQIILNNINFNKIFIHTISVEDNFVDKKVDKILKKKGFILIYTAYTDKILINKKSKYFKKRFYLRSFFAIFLQEIFRFLKWSKILRYIILKSNMYRYYIIKFKKN